MSFSDILADIGTSDRYILHAHTQFCDARAPMQDFAAEASRLGFTHYGFTPHSPIPIDSNCNMRRDDVPVYFAEVDRLQALYPDIKFYKGMEIDYLGDICNAADQYNSSLGLDYSISSVHFIKTQDGEWIDIDGRPNRFVEKYHECFHDDLGYIIDTYFSQSIDMVAKGGFDIIGHFDKIKLNASYVDPDVERTDRYRRWVGRLVDAIIAAGVAVEINTKSWSEFRHFFPSQRHWRTLLKAGVPIVVNSDVHYTDRIDAARPEVFKALDYLRHNL